MGKEINGVRIIGLGGIGGALAEPLCRYLSYTHRQSEPLELTFIDGDKFEAKNIERQRCSHDDIETNKAQATYDKLAEEFNLLDIEVFPHYITPKNVKDVIKEDDIVFMGVDNYKSRKVISDHCASLDNVILISGGNEWEDGNVQVFIRKDGQSITASLGQYHPEIEHPKDKSPDELGCAELMESAPQLLIMNLAVASMMLNVFYSVMTTENLGEMFGEVYLDIRQAKAMPANRKPVVES